MLTERGKYWVEELSGRVSSSCGGPEVGTRWWNARSEGRVVCEEGSEVGKGQVRSCFKEHGEESGFCS